MSASYTHIQSGSPTRNDLDGEYEAVTVTASRNPPAWARSEGRSVTSCPDKAAVYATEIGAREAADERARALGLTSRDFRIYLHRRCGFWHMTKAHAYAAFSKGVIVGAGGGGPHTLRSWDIIEEAELGTRAYAIGRRENLGSERRRKHWIHTVARKAARASVSPEEQEEHTQ